MSPVERAAKAIWDDWRFNGKTGIDVARDLTWEAMVAGAAERPKIADIVADARSQARAALECLRDPKRPAGAYHDDFKIIAGGQELSFPYCRAIGVMLMSIAFGMLLAIHF